MPDIVTTLKEHDEGLLPTLAQQWGVDTNNKDSKQLIEALTEAMQQPTNAEKVWDTLGDDQRGALLSLVSSGNASMATAMFKRLYGDIRKMGRGQIERELPHKKPQSIAEALYYRGFISEHFEKGKGKKGMQAFTYVPSDMIAALPTNKTSYKDLQNMPIPSQDAPTRVQNFTLDPVPDDFLENVQQADTSIVDDMTTLLALLRMDGVGVVEDEILPADVERLQPFLINPNPVRLAFMLSVGVSADLITTQEGRAYPKRSGLQGWLTQSRSAQIKTLLDAWYTSTIWRDMWHVSGLHPDPDAGFPYDPTVGRESLRQFLIDMTPHSDWWATDEFIDAIKGKEPDFQRPGGDYSAWYIRNDMGEYLNGYESWDAVDGALIDFYIKGPLHWLGLTDITIDAARLTAYGRAFIGLMDFPMPPEQEEPILVQDDGILIASRKVSRVDRFQVARFTTWGEWRPEEPVYYYRLDAEGIQRAAQQGITTQHIATFLQRQLNGKPLPNQITSLLNTWSGGAAAEVSFERVLVLRTTSPDILDRIYNEPSLRRYLGAKLGAMACIIRDGQENDLKSALESSGIHVDIIGGS